MENKPEYKPVRTALLVNEILRLIALAVLFSFFSPLKGAINENIFPFLAIFTPNALFSLMSLFLFISLWDYQKYLSLYLAGKLITVITFFMWCIITLRPVLNQPYLGVDSINFYNSFILLAGGFVLNMGDILSIIGSMFLINKIRLFRKTAGENGGL